MLTLALGIGATTAIFSVVYSVLIKPLPYPNANELVRLRHNAPGISAYNFGHNKRHCLQRMVPRAGWWMSRLCPHGIEARHLNRAPVVRVISTRSWAQHL